MKILKFALYIIPVILFFFCKKEKIPNDIFISHEISNLVYYPYDTIKLALKLNVSGGTEPYVIVLNKNAVNNPLEIPLKFKSVGSYSATVSDSKNQVKNYTLTINGSNYDPLVYDYRKPFIGNYDCIMTASYIVQTDTTRKTITNPPLSTTVNVSTSQNFSDLTIDKLPNDVPFSSSSKTFIGFHYSGSFKGDSIFIIYQPGTALYWENYKGKKIK